LLSPLLLSFRSPICELFTVSRVSFDPRAHEPTASWTPPQAGLESNGITNLNDVFFGPESSQSDLQVANRLQTSDWTSSNTEEGFLPYSTSELFLSPPFEAFGADVPNMFDANYIREPTLGVGIPQSGVPFMNGHDDFTAAPNSTSSNPSNVLHEGIQPSAATTSLEAQTSQAVQVRDASQVANLPSPAGQFTCGWLGCQLPSTDWRNSRMWLHSEKRFQS
jgi:hypothetical protein